MKSNGLMVVREMGRKVDGTLCWTGEREACKQVVVVSRLRNRVDGSAIF